MGRRVGAFTRHPDAEARDRACREGGSQRQRASGTGDGPSAHRRNQLLPVYTERGNAAGGVRARRAWHARLLGGLPHVCTLQDAQPADGSPGYEGLESPRRDGARTRSCCKALSGLPTGRARHHTAKRYFWTHGPTASRARYCVRGAEPTARNRLR